MSDASHQRRRQIDDLVAEALERPAEQRSAFLDHACGDDAALRAEVDELLAVHAEAAGFLADPSPGARTQGMPESAAAATADDEIGKILGGKYKLLEQLGEGTFGTVFMAEQTEPVRRFVAVKRLNPGMNSREVLARFDAERQALAVLEHPNVAKVFDAGRTSGGLPYFVMELVRGVAITEYCDKHRLDTRARLELFVQVCNAVQHAHQKGIIHRDLKPGNILVARYDDKAVPKVIDFGIAKAVGQQLTDRTLFTRFGGVLGTLLYMSPEQATLNAADIDTRTDIYALGAVLYELLTGSTPLAEQLSSKAAFDKLLGVVREAEPLRPSTRMSTISKAGAATDSIAEARGAQVATLGRQFRRELDWIVMKALAKERARRYDTAAGFARDVERYLRGDVVEARAPTLGYLTGKFLRKHRGPVIAVTLLILALVAGIIGTRNGMIRAEKGEASARTEKAQADIARDDARNAAKEATEQRTKAESNLLKSEWQGYAGQIGQAMLEGAAGHGRECRDALDACRWDFRGWEHDWLMAKYDADNAGRRSMSRRERDVAAIMLSPDGTRVTTLSGGAALGGSNLYHWVLDSELTYRSHVTISEMNCLAQSPDGLRCYVGGRSGEIEGFKVWGERIELPWKNPAHVGAIRCIAVSPDGQCLASGGDDGHLRIWRPNAAGPAVDVAANAGGVRALAFDPQSKRLVTGGNDNYLRLWDVASGKLIFAQEAHQGPVSSVAFLDGDRIFSGGADGRVNCWDAKSGKLIASLHGHRGPVTTLASASGPWIASGGNDGTVRLWPVDLGAEPVVLLGHSSAIAALAFAPDGNTLVSVSGNYLMRTEVKRWDIAAVVAGAPRTFTGDLFADAGFAADGEHLLTLEKDGRVRAWAKDRNVNPLIGLPATRPAPPAPPATSGATQPTTREIRLARWWRARGMGAISGNGRRAVACSEDKGIDVIDLDVSGAVTQRRYIARPLVTGLFLDREGKHLAVQGADHSLDLYDLDDASPQPRHLGSNAGNSVAFSPDGGSAAWSAGNVVTIYDLGAAKPLRNLELPESRNVTTIAFSATGTSLAVATNTDQPSTAAGTIYIYRAADGALTRTLESTGAVYSMAFTNDESRLVTGGGRDYDLGGEVRFWSLSSRVVVMRFGDFLRPVKSVAFDASGRRLAVTEQLGDADTEGDAALTGGAVRIYDAGAGQRVFAMRDNDGWSAEQVAFSADGRRIAATFSTLADAPQLRVWDAVTGRPLPSPPAGVAQSRDSRFFTIAMSPGCERVVVQLAEERIHSSGFDEDPETGPSVANKSPPFEIRFSPDGAHFAVRVDKRIRLFESRTCKLLSDLPGVGVLDELLAIDNQSRWIVARGNTGTADYVDIFDARTAKRVNRIRTSARTRAASFSPDGSTLYTCGHDCLVRAWRVRDWIEERSYFGHDSVLTGIALSPDGKYIAAGGTGLVMVWDAKTSAVLHRFPDPAREASGISLMPELPRSNLAFSPDSRRLAIAGDSAVFVWEIDKPPPATRPTRLPLAR